MNQNPNKHFTLTINGEKLVFGDLSPTMTLLEFLRGSGRVGTKEGCGDGDCGACTVAIIGESSNGVPCFQAVNSCLIPLGAVAGREIVTVEGIGNGKPHPVQAAMIETGGSQCGYCTPGFVMSMFAAYYDGKITDAAIEGNLCRCTGYLPIRRAAERLTKFEDRFSEKLNAANLENDSFVYETDNQKFYRPTTLKEILDLLEQFPEAVLVAGATDLGLEFSWHTKEFPILISTENAAELKTLIQTEEFVEIGAAVSLTRIEEKLKGVFPSLDEMLHWFAARQIKNRATVGGNIGTASPIGDLPPVFLSLDAELNLASANGERTILLADFFKGYRQTDLRAGEIIVSVKLSKLISDDSVHCLQQSYKVGKRGTDDISIVAAAFAIDLNRENRIVKARLAYGGVAAIPARARGVEDWLTGKTWNPETVRDAKEQLKNAFTPLNDVRGSAEYRKLLVANLFEKFFVEMETIR
ncbi:MAG TPA: xanthine dehydrogenase small subunit [Pyrinomonadaceae bacterium]|jgi:xanthine dehydrogenase small subunit